MIAFDTSSQACSVALLHENKINQLHQIVPMQHTKLILPMIEELLLTSHLSFTDLQAIAYGCGPGSFTGIRIASCVAQALGFAKALPIIPISSLAAIAESAFLEHKVSKILVAVNASMGRVYWGKYILNQQGSMELCGEEQLGTLKEMIFPEVKGWAYAGDGFEIYRDILIPQIKAPLEDIYSAQLPTAEAIVQLAKTKWENRQWVSASHAIPTYLH